MEHGDLNEEVQDPLLTPEQNAMSGEIVRPVEGAENNSSAEGAKNNSPSESNWAWIVSCAICKVFFSGILSVLGCFGYCAATASVLKGFCGPLCPLSRKWGLRRKTFADLLESVSTIAVMGVLTLNIYCATYFVAWVPKEGNPCKYEVLFKWAKLIVVGLPFTLFPMTLYVAGQARAAQNDNRLSLGLVAGGVLFEIVYILAMGGLMTVCMSMKSWWQVSIVTGLLSLFLYIIWGCCCYWPRCLRRCLACICFWESTCGQDDERAAGEDQV